MPSCWRRACNQTLDEYNLKRKFTATKSMKHYKWFLSCYKSAWLICINTLSQTRSTVKGSELEWNCLLCVVRTPLSFHEKITLNKLRHNFAAGQRVKKQSTNGGTLVSKHWFIGCNKCHSFHQEKHIKIKQQQGNHHNNKFGSLK